MLVRVLGSAFLGVAVTFGLLYLMHVLVLSAPAIGCPSGRPWMRPAGSDSSQGSSTGLRRQHLFRFELDE